MKIFDPGSCREVHPLHESERRHKRYRSDSVPLLGFMGARNGRNFGKRCAITQGDVMLTPNGEVTDDQYFKADLYLLPGQGFDVSLAYHARG